MIPGLPRSARPKHARFKDVADLHEEVTLVAAPEPITRTSVLYPTTATIAAVSKAPVMPGGDETIELELDLPDSEAKPIEPPETGGRLPAHARAFAAHRTAKGIGLVLIGAITFGLAGAATAAIRITGNITSVDADSILADHGIERPARPTPAPEDPEQGHPLNILVMGSDYRGGENLQLGGGGFEPGARSDTTMIVHISADRRRAEIVSIPRDTMVDIPQCPTSGGDLSPAVGYNRFNAAFAFGEMRGGDVESAALCTLTTVEAITNVRMDGFVVMDFAGFRNMVDALGGVDIYVERAIFSPKADDLRLPAGWNHLDGVTALQFARARIGQGLGDGSDLGRIERQQQLMTAIAGEDLDSNLLTDTPSLIRFLNAATRSMTMSANFASINGLAGLGYSLRHIRPDALEFIMAPIALNPRNPNTLVFTEDAERLWHNMRHGLPLTSGDTE
ncbi:MAG: LCP family protein [Promicromonosporaceae bacterium]|nr:LCP family protein [Promicromonosporaceae bacterium]